MEEIDAIMKLRNEKDRNKDTEILNHIMSIQSQFIIEANTI